MIKLLLLAAVLAAPAHRAVAQRKRAPKRRPAVTAPAAAPAQPAPVLPHERRPGIGTVTYATGRRAYLDAGSRGGLAAGAEVRLERAGRPAATCRVEVVGENEATCVGTGVRTGDTFALQPPPASAAPAPRRLPPLVASAEQSRRRATVAAVTFEKVDFKATQAPAPVAVYRGAEISLGHATWAAYGTGPLQQEHLNVALYGVPLGGGIRAYLDLSALHWTVRNGSRFRPDDRNQLYVWEAELAARDPGRSLVFALGRVRPWNAPGSSVFDGVQAGWRPAPNAEIGLFGGGIPSPETLSPTLARRTGGLYLALEQSGRSGILVREEVRLAAVKSPELGSRAEAEAEGQVFLGKRIQGTADLRFGIGDSSAPGNLDAARVDLSVRPVDRVTLLGSYRYVGLDSFVLSNGVSTGLGPSRHADLAAAVDATSWLTVSAAGGYAKDLTVGVERRWYGPEVTLPRLLGGRASVGAGWHEEAGWVGGRDVFVQIGGQPAPWLRLFSRVSYFRDTHAGTIPDESGGIFLNGMVDFTQWLSLRVSVLGRMSLGQGEAPGGHADGLAGQVDLVGSY